MLDYKDVIQYVNLPFTYVNLDVNRCKEIEHRILFYTPYSVEDFVWGLLELDTGSLINTNHNVKHEGL